MTDIQPSLLDYALMFALSVPMSYAFMRYFPKLRKLLHLPEHTREPIYYLSTYTKPPTKSKLDDLASYMIFGLDLKIDQDNKVNCIEINGLRSGMSGFEKAESMPPYDSSKDSLSYALRYYARWLYTNNPSFELRKDHLLSYGKYHQAFIDQLLLQSMLQKGIVPNELLQGSDLIWQEFFADPNRLHPDWFARYIHIATTMLNLEQILNDKLALDQCFDPQRQYKPKSHLLTPDEAQSAFAQDSDYFVIKPRCGSIGREVSIIPRNLTSILEYNDKYIIESFVPSKPIKSRKTKDKHDGCMRYIVIAEEDNAGTIQIYHFGGYWRLCPLPISQYGNIDAMRANLTKNPHNPLGAIPQRASGKDLKLARNAVDEFLPNVYELMLNKARMQETHTPTAYLAVA